jgi:hypothetical protein
MDFPEPSPWLRRVTRDDLLMQRAQPTRFDRFATALGDHEASLLIGITIDQHEELPAAKEAEELLGIACAFGKAHPQHVDGYTELLERKAGARG